MALVKCSDCGEKISKKAKSCPKCGAPQKKKTSLFTWLVAIFLVLVAIGTLTSTDNPSSNRNAASPTETKKEGSGDVSASEQQRLEVQKHFQGESEPTAKDAVWTSGSIFKVGVLDDGTPRDGYASYVCEVLYEKGFRGMGIWVQVIDIVQLTRKNDWVKLGEARCQ